MTIKKIQDLGRKLGLTDAEVRTRDIYVNWLYRKFGLTDMAGLVDDGSPVQVEKMYIPRCFSEENIPEEKDDHRIKRAGEDQDKGLKRDILYWLKQKPFLMIAGLPGAGKTWLVHELALETGIRKGTPFNNTYPWIIPIPLVLREHDLKGIDSLDGLMRVFLEDVRKNVLKDDPLIYFNPRRNLEKYRRQGQFLILLDGIDEVGPEKRIRIMKWTLEAFSQEEIHNHYIITGRPAGFEDLRTDGSPRFSGETVMLHLLPFTDKQKEDYIGKWHELRPAPREAEKKAKKDSLIEALAGRKYLSSMARRPSFMALICFVHNTLGELPHSRATLYEKIMDAYILQLERVRNISIPPWEKLDLLFLLSRLAFDWQRGNSKNSKERIMSESWEEVTQRFSKYLKEQNRFHSIREEDAEKLLPFYLARTGILSEPEAGTIRFAHNSFQEYLTAYYLNVRHQEGRRSFPFLLERADSEFWRESGHLFLSLRQKDSQNIAYRSLLRELNLNEAEQRLFLAEILGSEEVAFSEEERKRWMEVLLLAEMNGTPDKAPWNALLKRKENAEKAHDLINTWLREEDTTIKNAMKVRWSNVNQVTYLGVDWNQSTPEDDPLADNSEDPKEAFFVKDVEWPEDVDFYLRSWTIKASLHEYGPEKTTDEDVEKRLNKLDRALLYTEKAFETLSLTIQTTFYYRSLPLPPVSLFWRDIFLLLPRNIFALKQYGWLKKIRAFQLLFLGEIFTEARARALDRARALALDLALDLDLDRDRKLALALDLDLVLALGRARALDRGRDLSQAIARALDLDQALALTLVRARAQAQARALDLALDRDLALALALDLDLDLARTRTLDRDLALALDLDLDLARTRTLDRDLVREGNALCVSAVFYMTAYCLLGKKDLPSYKKEDLCLNKRPWKEEIRLLLKENNERINLDIEGWNDADYAAVQREDYWPGNLARQLGKHMDNLNLDIIDFSPKAFTARFNKRVALFKERVKQFRAKRKQ